ncbi:condensation domain-containing protein [Plantactinospora soyae]|uniref:Condensation domain-containing protein n=1 Tax=Plantactinospora soyae TaxID=1544732 RepID=A0A927R9F7_9ACTN|nr:condensation domain-containing protein [Plantactinospora soyae]MBE1489751.1 hypothetical protein [Plantactinospora soyae]
MPPADERNRSPMTIETERPRTGAATGRRDLSASQAFMCAFDQGDDTFGAFGPRNIVTAGWRLRGELDLTTLQAALDDVAARHEGLRTLIVRDEGEPYGRVHPPSPVDLTVSELTPAGDAADRERRAHEFLNEVEGDSRCDITRMPLLRASLGRFGADDAVLVLVTHHTVSDAWSIHVVLRDIAICYANRRGFAEPTLPAMRQYGEHASWEQRALGDKSAVAAREYWKAKLDGAKFVTVPTDRVRRPDTRPSYAVHRFAFDKELFTATNALAKSMRCSSFMVLYACYLLFLHRRTGVRDILATTFMSGRAAPEFHETVGLFFNLVPIRVDVSGCVTFRDLVSKTRATLFEAMSYELPFREVLAQAAPDLMSPYGDPHGVVITFEVNHYPQTLDEELVGDLRYSGLRRRLISDTDTSEIPSGSLWDFDLDPAGEMLGVVKFNSLEFDESSILSMLAEYRDLLRAGLASPDSELFGSGTGAVSPAT